MRTRPPLDQTWELGDEYPDDTFNQRGYLNERGFPKLCRLEFKLTSIQELKQCAVHISELNGRLNRLAFEDQRPDLARVFHARAALAECQHLLKYIRSRQYRQAKKDKGMVLGGRKQRDARSSVPVETYVGKVDRPWNKKPDEVQPVDTKGETK